MNASKNLSFVFVIAALVSVSMMSCSKVKYKKSKGGMAYQLIPSKDTQRLRIGTVVKYEITQKAPGFNGKDSVYFSTYGVFPQYQQISGQTSPYDISELWTSLHVGDSLVTTQLIDTFMKRNPGSMPVQFKKGDKITSYVKIIGMFSSDSLAGLDYQNSVTAKNTAEDKLIESYLAEKKITTQKTPSGAFVEIIEPGAGNLVDSGNYVSVIYTGKHWNGEVFQSNVGAPALPATVGKGDVVRGMDEAFRFMRPNSKIRVYIPSRLAYGGQPDPRSPFKPFEILIFDMQLADIQPKAPVVKAPPVDPNQPQMQMDPSQMQQQH